MGMEFLLDDEKVLWMQDCDGCTMRMVTKCHLVHQANVLYIFVTTKIK